MVSIHAPAWGATCQGKNYTSTTACFNPRTRVGCDLPDAPASEPEEKFQSTHPRGVRRQGRSTPSSNACFNPRTRVGCDAGLEYLGSITMCFNPRTRVGCDVSFNILVSRRCLRFNPRTRVGCDTSPHTSSAGGLCFNPRTRVGCDEAVQSFQGLRDLFQSTHPRGVRRPDLYGPPGGDAVSIHAPAWGATFLAMAMGPRPPCFNPRTRVGCDISVYMQGLSRMWFQSTHPRGVRHKRRVWTHRLMLVSIHAPAWGATSAGRS